MNRVVKTVAMSLALLVVTCFGENSQAEFKAVAGWGRQLFPSFIIATAAMKTPEDLPDSEEVSDESDSESVEASIEGHRSNETFEEADSDEDESSTEESSTNDDDSEDGDEALEGQDTEDDEENETSGEEMSEEEENDSSSVEGIGQDAGAVLGDKMGLLGVTVVSPAAGTPVRVTISCDKIMEESSFVGELPEEGVEYSIFPKIRYKFDDLAAVTQSTPINVTYQVEVGSDVVEEQTAIIVLHSINDCPFMLYENGKAINLNFTFAAYVNEQHPFVDKLLRESLDRGRVQAFTGYQSKDEGEVLRQVYAIWDALVQRDVRYSSITTTVADSDMVACQSVRMIDETINNAQANCVDGSVLFASVLRKIDIEPFLILVPGHCYLGFYLDAERTKIVAIETTLIGDEPDDAMQAEEWVGNAIPEEFRDQSSWSTFAAAMKSGTENYQASEAKFQDPNEGQYRTISIANARKAGIMPIAFGNRESFSEVSASE